MASNEIKTLQFNQGVSVTLAPKVLNDRGSLPIPNNILNFNLTGLSFDLNEFAKVIVEYEIYRKTDAPFKAIFTGKMTLLADYVSNTWRLIKESEFGTDDSANDSGVTFNLNIVSGVAQLRASSTNQAGANHELNFYYILNTNLK